MLKRYPRQLSGGDQQRVSLARAMVRRPRVWLMDEPLGTLDADIRLEMREFIRQQQLEMKVTTVYVTHDQEEAMSLADRIVVMNAGTILQDGPPDEVYDKPADLFVANFVGSPGMNFIKGAIENGQFRASGATIPLPRAIRAGSATLGIRSEHLRIDPQGMISGRTRIDEFLGSHRTVHLECAFGHLIIREAAGDKLEAGSNVRVRFDANYLNFVDSDSGKRL